MKKVFLVFLIFFTSTLISQKFYDSNDLKYYLDFSNMKANLKFRDYKINGPIEEIYSIYGNNYTVIKGDSIHWALLQNSKKNQYSSYLILKGEYSDIIRMIKREGSSKRFEVLASDIIFPSSFKDYFNFVNEEDFNALAKDRQVAEYLKDFGFSGTYDLKVYRDSGISFINIEIKGSITFNQKGILIETNLPSLTKFSGEYSSDLNPDINLLKMGIVSGRIINSDGGIFSLSIDLKEMTGILTTIRIKMNDEDEQSTFRNVTTFKLIE